MTRRSCSGNDITTGASHDLKEATELVRRMVREWGMSDRVGPIDYSQTEDMLFGGEVVSRRNYSEAIALEIDQEVKRLIEECYGRARSLLEERADALRRLAEALLVREVLDNEQVDTILAGKPLPELPAGAQGGSKPSPPAPDPAGAKKQLDGEVGDVRGRPAPDLAT